MRHRRLSTSSGGTSWKSITSRYITPSVSSPPLSPHPLCLLILPLLLSTYLLLLFPQSLDHQGITFKATDTRAMRSKSLIGDIETIFDERQEQLTEGASTTGPHLHFTFPVSGGEEERKQGEGPSCIFRCICCGRMGRLRHCVTCYCRRITVSSVMPLLW